jgi:hypothetical protein
LSNGTSYTFTVTATHANGNSPASASSNAATPVVPTAGFWSGGVDQNNSRSSTTYKFNFTAETYSSVASMNRSHYNQASSTNSGVAGYLHGGQGNGDVEGVNDNAYTTKILKFSYTTDAYVSMSGVLSPAKASHIGLSYGNTAGFALGNSGGSTNIQKITYSNDAVSTSGATLPAARATASAGLSNGSTAGYIMGGSADGSTYTSAIQKLTVANDSTSTLSATLSSNTDTAGNAENGTTAGYAVGGYSPSGSTRRATTDKLSYSAETVSTIASNLSVATGFLKGISKFGSASYLTGGNIVANANHTEMHKLTFSTDTMSFLGNTWTGYNSICGMSNNG